MLDKFIQEFSRAAAKQGIEQIDFYGEETAGANASIFKSEIESLIQYERRVVFVEGCYQGYCGTAYTENLEQECYESLIKKIKETALENKKPFTPRNMPQCVKAEETLVPGTGLELLLDAERIAYSDSRVKHVQCQSGQGSRRVILANQSGEKAEDFQSFSGASVFVMANDGEKTQTGRDGAMADARIGAVDPCGLALLAKDRAVTMLHAKSLPSGSRQVVLSGQVLREMLSMYISSFYGSAILDNKSVLKGKKGSRIGSELVTLKEEPAGNLPRRFDDEGTLCSSKNIIEQGVLKTWLHSQKSAKELNDQPTGNGFKRDYLEDVATGYTNLVLEPGEDSLEAVLKQEGNGLYITECDGMFAGANVISGDFALISKGYLVENGKLGDAVAQITIAGNFFTMLNQIKAVADDSEVERFGSSTVTAPSVWVGELSVSGRSES